MLINRILRLLFKLDLVFGIRGKKLKLSLKWKKINLWADLLKSNGQ